MYDSVADTWSATGGMAAPRSFYASALLQDGRVLAAGAPCRGIGGPSAELFDPIAGTWTATVGMAVPTRTLPTATTLPDGRVLVVGGEGATIGSVVALSELYLASSADFTIAASPTTLSLVQGTSGTSAIVTTQVGSAGTVGLAIAVSPASANLTASVSPSVVAAGSSATLTVAATASVAPGTYTVTVTGTEGSATHSTTVTVTVTASTPTTCTFDDLANPNRPLTETYCGIDWDTTTWYLSGPYSLFTTQSVSYPDGTPLSAPFTFITPRTLIQFDAANGGTVASTITLSCTGNPTVTQVVAVNTAPTITTNWTQSCSTVTVGSTNGWDTNFGNLTYR